MTQVYLSNITTNKNMRLQIECSLVSDIKILWKILDWGENCFTLWNMTNKYFEG